MTAGQGALETACGKALNTPIQQVIRGFESSSTRTGMAARERPTAARKARSPLRTWRHHWSRALPDSGAPDPLDVETSLRYISGGETRRIQQRLYRQIRSGPNFTRGTHAL